MTITICASIEFSDVIIRVKEELEKMGHGVFIPCYTQKILDGEVTLEEYKNRKEQDGGDTALRDAVPVDFIKRYWDCIHDSDAILVLNLTKK